MTLLRLFYEFFKTGLFSIGGGMATLPFLSDMGEKTGWFTDKMLMDMLAVSESTPGPIGVNMATYVGFTVSGLAGAVTATLGLMAPSIIITVIIASLLREFRNSRVVSNTLYGIRPASTALIAAAALEVLLIVVLNPDAADGAPFIRMINLKGAALFLVLWLLTNFVKPVKKLHPLVLISFSAAVGAAFSFAGA